MVTLAGKAQADVAEGSIWDGEKIGQTAQS